MFPLLVCAQPNYRLYDFNIKTGEGENYYEREAKRNFEPGTGAMEDANVPDRFQTSMGLINAATGLKIAKRKGSISDLQELLRANFDWITQSNLSAIEDLESQSATFVDDETVNQKAELVNYYTVLDKYNRALRSMPPTKFEGAKKKDPKLALDVVSYSEQLSAARESLNTAKESAAGMHYEKGRELARSMEMEASKSAAKEFRYAYQYVDNYRDSKDRYVAARKLGTTRLGVSEFTNLSNSEYGNIGSTVTGSVLSRFTRSEDEFEFFEVLDRDALNLILEEQKLSLSGLMDESTTAEMGELTGVNSLLVGKVTQASTDRQRFDPVMKQFEKEVKVGEETYTDEDGKEKKRDIKKTVTVNMTYHRKIANATVGATFKILDVRTGRLVAADDFTQVAEWEGDWYAYRSGDRRAIPKRYENQTEIEYISSGELVQDAANRVGDRVNDVVGKYAREVSQ